MSQVSSSKKFAGYDIIGDIHGCAETLKRLLQKLGYSKKSGVYQHPNRQVVFVGDIIDRGPRIREALHIVRDMIEKGYAQCVMGNHEYNAIGYHTLAPPDSGQTYLREHTPHHNRLIAETLEQFANYPDDWKAFVDWFIELPVFLELPHFRVVHACWDQTLIDQYMSTYDSNKVSLDFIRSSVDRDSFSGKFMDRLTRGTDLKLPDGHHISGRDGVARRFFRTKFWSHEPETYADVVFQPDPLPEHIIKRPISDWERRRLIHYPITEKKLFVGHYWLQGKPKPLRPNLACLDYSAVKYGRLVSYRLDSELHLEREKFVWEYVNTPERGGECNR